MRLLEELFNRVKVIVAQEESEKRHKEFLIEKQKREAEEAEEEEAKRLRLEKEEQELKEKIARNLAEAEKQNSSDEHDANADGEFELRKNLMELNDSNKSNSSPERPSLSNAPIVMPRAVLLSNPQLQSQIQTNQAKLYDEEDIVESNHSQKSNEEIEADKVSDTSQNNNEKFEESQSQSETDLVSNDSKSNESHND